MGIQELTLNLTKLNKTNCKMLTNKGGNYLVTKEIEIESNKKTHKNLEIEIVLIHEVNVNGIENKCKNWNYLEKLDGKHIRFVTNGGVLKNLEQKLSRTLSLSLS